MKSQNAVKLNEQMHFEISLIIKHKKFLGANPVQELEQIKKTDKPMIRFKKRNHTHIKAKTPKQPKIAKKSVSSHCQKYT